MRRTLIDLARHYQGPRGLGANHASNIAPPMDLAEDTPDRGETPRDLERWSAFHEAVEALPEDEREIFSLLFYHGLTQPEGADLLKLSSRTVRRQWRAACLRLREALADELPQG